MSSLLVLTVVLPALVGPAALLVPASRRGPVLSRVGAAVTGLGFLLAVVLAVLVSTGGPVSAVVTAGDGTALVGLTLDRLSALLLLLVLGVGTVVHSFSRRYLRGDPRAARLAVLTGFLLTATGAMVSAVTLVGLAVAWSATGLALLALLGHFRGLPAADEGVRRTARAFALGDGALWLAIVVATLAWGPVDLRDLGAQVTGAGAGPAVTSLVAVLLVVAAMARSAQLPLPGWLPATLAAPTPVSALLHAGVVNAGGVLLIRTGDVFGASATATWLAFTAGAVTAVYGTVLMLVSNDVKGSLAHSTVGQMGFMVMTCGLGAYAAAAFHLVAHGMYKATLFLGSGSAVSRHVRAAKAPPRTAATSAVGRLVPALAVAVPVLALALAAWALAAHADGRTGSTALLLFAWATGAAATAGWLRRHPTGPGLLTAVVAVLLTAFGYVSLFTAVTDWLLPALAPPAVAAVPTGALVAVAVVFAAGWALLRSGSPGARRAREALYVQALARTATRTRPGRSAGAAPDGALFPVLAVEGGRS